MDKGLGRVYNLKTQTLSKRTVRIKKVYRTKVMKVYQGDESIFWKTHSGKLTGPVELS